MKKKKVIKHLKGDIKTFKHEAAEDRKLIKELKHKKHEKGESKKHESRESKKHEKKEKKHEKHEDKKKHHSAVVKKAMHHPDVLGAGAKKRKHLKPKDKVGVVMSEFKRGTLHSGSGEKVTNPRQGIAIALSEAGLSKKKPKHKKKK
jgi:hypothetical protein